MWSWKELYFQHGYEDGVLELEFQQELQWAQQRKLSMSHAFQPTAPDGQPSPALQPLIDHYGVERVSAAKDRTGKW